MRLLPEGALVLDVGCGEGESSPPGVVGMDASLPALEQASRRGVTPVLADAEAAWPFVGSRFDAVLVFDVLEHVPDPEFLLAEARRVLKPGGLLVAAIPNAAHLANRVSLLLGKTSDFTDAGHRRGAPVSDHLHRFSRTSAARLLLDNGFEPVAWHGYFPSEFTEGPWKALSILARLARRAGLARLTPGLLAYEFLFACRMTAGEGWAEVEPTAGLGGRDRQSGGTHGRDRQSRVDSGRRLDSFVAPAASRMAQGPVTSWDEDDSRYRGYRAGHGGYRLDHRVRQALRLTPAVAGGCLLDLGAGDAFVTSVLTDSSGAALGVAADLGFAEPLVHSVVSLVSKARVDLSRPLPFRDACADLVVSLETIEHMSDPDAFLTEIRRVLAPGGSLILSTPRLDSLLVVASLLLGFQPPGVEASARRRYGSPLGEGRPSGHLHLFTRRALGEALTANGFRIEAYREGRFSSSWRQARITGRRRRARDLLLEVFFFFYDLLPFRKDVMVVRAVPRDRVST